MIVTRRKWRDEKSLSGSLSEGALGKRSAPWIPGYGASALSGLHFKKNARKRTRQGEGNIWLWTRWPRRGEPLAANNRTEFDGESGKPKAKNSHRLGSLNSGARTHEH